MTRPAPLSDTLATYRAAVEIAHQHAAQGTPVDPWSICDRCEGEDWSHAEGCPTLEDDGEAFARWDEARYDQTRGLGGGR